MTTTRRSILPKGINGNGTDHSSEEQTASAKKFRFPSAFTVLFGVTITVWLLAFVVPTGAYQTDSDSGRPIPGSYQATDSALSFGDRLMELFMAPVNGLYGVINPDGYIGPYESGELYGAAGVFLFVLAIGVFITMAMKTGAIDNGVARVAQRMSTRGAVLIAVLMVLFSIGGTTEGMAEETLASTRCSSRSCSPSATTAWWRRRRSWSVPGSGSWRRPSTRSRPASARVPRTSRSVTASASAC